LWDATGWKENFTVGIHIFSSPLDIKILMIVYFVSGVIITQKCANFKDF